MCLRTCAAYGFLMTETQATLRVRWHIVSALRETRGLEDDGALARAMGVNPSSVSRVTNGKQQPGPRFIAGLCAALNAKMTDLFEVIAPEATA